MLRSGLKFVVVILALVLAGPAWSQGRRRASPPPNGGNPGARRYQPEPYLQGPGPHIGDWLRRHQGLSLQDQEQALQRDPDFQRLDPRRQDRLRDRLEKFDSLPPEQQERILRRMETLEHLTPQQQKRARHLFQDFRNLPPERRQDVEQAFRDLRGMNPDERAQALDSPAFHERFSDQERELLRGLTTMTARDSGSGPPKQP